MHTLRKAEGTPRVGPSGTFIIIKSIDPLLTSADLDAAASNRMEKEEEKKKKSALNCTVRGSQCDSVTSFHGVK